MTALAPDSDLVTLFSVFRVEPEDQQRLIDLIVAATEAIMRHRPGFVSATVQKGLDGRQVVNCARWRSRAALQAALQDPAARAHMAEVVRLASVESHLYRAVSSHPASEAVAG